VSAAFSSSPPRDKSRQHEHIAQIFLRNSPQREYATYLKKYRVVKSRKVSSVKLLPAEAPLLSQPPLNIAANPLKRLSTELDRTGQNWIELVLHGCRSASAER